ncbi:uncharacterized protein LOC144027275 [Festucalex cinctus]
MTSKVNVNCNEEELPEEPFEPLTQEASVPLTQASPLRTTKDVNRSEQNVGAGWQLSREPGDLVSTPQSRKKTVHIGVIEMYLTESEDEMDVMEQIIFPLTQEASLPLTQTVSSLHLTQTGSPGGKKKERKSKDGSKKLNTSDKTVGDGQQVSREASPQLMEMENVHLREAEPDFSDWEDEEKILERALFGEKHVQRLNFDLKSRKKKKKMKEKLKLKKKDKVHPKGNETQQKRSPEPNSVPTTLPEKISLYNNGQRRKLALTPQFYSMVKTLFEREIQEKLVLKKRIREIVAEQPAFRQLCHELELSIENIRNQIRMMIKRCEN